MNPILYHPLIKLATAAPIMGKSVLTVAAHAFRNKKPHWALRQVARELDYLIPVDTHLGNGMKIRVIWTDSVGTEILTHGYYELPVVRLMEQLVRPGMVFIDAGAHVGQYTLLAAGLGANVHSFEPDPRTFQLLLHNVNVNGLKNVRLNRCALADVCKCAALRAGPIDNIGSSSLSSGPSEANSCSVPCVSLDSYVEQNHLSDVHVMKIDVEGSELPVLRGAQGILSRGSGPEIIIEFAEENQQKSGFSCFQLEQFLTDCGYELALVSDSGLVSYSHRRNERGFLNVLARPNRRHTSVGAPFQTRHNLWIGGEE